jgi:hypothetical protein
MKDYRNNPEEAVTLYQTNAYDSGPDPDVDDTEKYGKTIYLGRDDGITIDYIFAETAASGTDNLLVRLYRRGDPKWTGNEAHIKEVDLGDTSGEGSLVVDATRSGAGYYRWGAVSDGTTDHFDLKETGRTWRK